MVDHTLRSLGRYVMAACAVGLVAASLSAQTPAAPAATSGTNPSRVDIFLGYSYFSTASKLNPAGISYSSITGGMIASGAYYHNRYLGGEAIFTDHPSGVNDGVSGISVGPIFRLPMDDFTLFGHGLVGTARLGGPNTTIAGLREARTLQVGDWADGRRRHGHGPAVLGQPLQLACLRGRLSLYSRRFRALCWAPDGRNPGRARQSECGGTEHRDCDALWPHHPAATGDVQLLGCAIELCIPGDPITVTGVALNLNPKKTATYTWTTDGGVISGTSATANVDTKAAAPGSYTVKGHVTEGVKPGQMADCSATFTVKAFDPPTISCSANPSSVNPGESSTITASAMSPQNRPLTYSYNAAAGSISSTTASATLSTVGAAPGPIAVTCRASDDVGHTVEATTSVNVIAPPPPPPPPAPLASSLCPVSFERDAKRPERVDNEAKACLDDVALSLQRSTDAKLALVGNEDAKEKAADDKIAKREAKMKQHEDQAERCSGTRREHQGLPGDGEGHRSVAHPGVHRDRRRQDGDDDADSGGRSQPGGQRHGGGRERSEGCAPDAAVKPAKKAAAKK